MKPIGWPRLPPDYGLRKREQKRTAVSGKDGGRGLSSNPTIGIEIQFPLDALGRVTKPAQIVGCLFQHTGSQTFFRRCRWRFGGRNKKMCAASVVRFRT